MTNLQLDDTEAAVLSTLLTYTIESDRYPPGARVQTLRAILAKLRQEPVRPSRPPALKPHEPPSKGRHRQRG